MLTYSAAELRALADVDRRPPPRAVRKRLFTFGLWRPVRQRRSTAAHRPVAALGQQGCGRRDTAAKRSADRSTDPCSMAIGWLNACSVRNKVDAISDTITDKRLDVLAIQETWHTTSDDTCLRLVTPAGYAIVDAARTTGPGGGVAVVFRQHLKCTRMSMPVCKTFESICVRLETATGPVIVMSVYRPGSANVSMLFFDELATVLEALVVYACPVVVGGDFNIHAQDVDDPDARRLSDLLASFDMVQHVHGPTHRCGNTLDLVVTPAQCQLDGDVTVDPAGMLSDHSLVVCRVPVAVQPAPVFEHRTRSWRRVDRETLRLALEESELCQPVSPDADVDQLFDKYDTVLRGIADRLAPLHTVRRRHGRRAPWFDAECRNLRRECRRFERRYRRTYTAGERRQWVDATRRRHQTYRAKKEQYWLARLTNSRRSSSQLWQSLSTLLGRNRDAASITGHSAAGFASFFARKIDDIRAATAGVPPAPTAKQAASSLSSFRPCTPDEVRRIVMASPVKSCSLDAVPTFIVHEFVDVLLPYLTSMVNASLAQGRLPTSQRHAVVTPLLKKTGLDTADMSNFRPVSNLSFMSKVVERAVASQLTEYLSANGLLPCLQSAYRKRHSTETAMLRVWSDILMAADVQQVTLLAMLDLSAAFDCVDHTILLQRLQVGAGLTDVVLEWIASFLSERTQQIAYVGELSSLQLVLFGVPQGSVLGPLLYVLYTAELFDVVARHRLRLHMYADDSQVYVSTPANDAVAAVDRLTACIADINDWMKASRLRLNPAKTQIMWLGTSQQLDKITVRDVPLLSTEVTVVDSARNLGVIIDSHLSLDAHVPLSVAVATISYGNFVQ